MLCSEICTKQYRTISLVLVNFKDIKKRNSRNLKDQLADNLENFCFSVKVAESLRKNIRTATLQITYTVKGELKTISH